MLMEVTGSPKEGRFEVISTPYVPCAALDTKRCAVMRGKRLQ
jgi:hypothetical protein